MKIQSYLVFIFPFLYSSNFVSAEKLLVRGQEIYSQICVTCHGPNLDGGNGPSLVDTFRKNGDISEAIMRSITKGISGRKMIAFGHAYSDNDRQTEKDQPTRWN